MTGRLRALWLGASALPMILLLAGEATAQQAGNFETILVEARKRVEDPQTIPISLSAYSQDDLDRLNVKTVEDLRYSSPSLYIAPSSFRQDTLNITLRGQRNFDAPSGGGNSGLSFDTATAVYKDGVYYARAIGLTGSLFDLENVQVLKGPQGTLVGRNTTGGAVLYQSKEPTADYDAWVRGTLGDYGRAGIQGIVNIPLTDTISVRAAVNADNQKGYISNHFLDPVSGASNSQAAMGSDKLAALLSLKWQPSDDFKLVLRADLATEHDTGSTYHDLGYFVGTVLSQGRTSICNIPATCPSTTNPGNPTIAFTDLLGHQVGSYYLTANATGVGAVNTAPAAYNALLNSLAREQAYGFWSTEQALSNLDVGHYQTYSVTADEHLDDLDIRWMTAYRTWNNTGQAVSRGQPFEMNTYKFNIPDYESWQSELTVNGSAFADQVKWTGGLFYFTERSPNDGGLLYLFLPAAGGAPQAVAGRQLTITDSRNNSEQNRSYAAYAQAVWTVTPDTRLTAGVRYTYDERFAAIATQNIRTPSTQALANAQKNGVFNSAAVTYEGISYAGQTDYCTLTDASAVALPLSQCAANVRRSYHKPTWTLALDHDLLPGTMVYATMRSGYRSGAINTQATNIAALTVLPEEVLDYEIGVKSDFAVAQMPVRLNLAAYNTRYHNIQTQQSAINVSQASVPGGGACTQAAFNAGQCIGTSSESITLNAKTARIYGMEWDVQALPTDWLTLGFSGSYIDPRFTDFTFLVPAGYLQPANSNLSGTPIPVPAWQTNETVTFNLGHDAFGLPLGDASFTAHYYWQSRTMADLRNYNPAQRTFAYGLLNLRLEFKDFLKDRLDLAFYANNVAGTQACLPEFTGVLNSAPNGTFGTPNTSGLLQCIPLAPRMVGMQLSYRF
ncbi:MAG: TonB-dependent receptor [Alphaproteobacteria bacterium]|nr:TonB-dependent receptor [Alphaproteobacteria bacterium]